MTKVFIDGSAGTTGLRIHERLAERRDIELITLGETERRDTAARREALNSADIVFLCLPDAAAVEAVGMIENGTTRVIDTSTAHRTSDGWEYGFPELHGRRERIANAARVANPGCHASGFIALVTPLLKAGIIAPEARLSCLSLTGYSGGGKKMIAEYEGAGRDPLYDAPRMYGLSQSHKHLPEMTAVTGLKNAPVFCPVVAPYYAGMEVTVPITSADLIGDSDIDAVRRVYGEYYTGDIVRYRDSADEGGFISAGAYAGRDDMEISVYGNGDRILLVARFDNLGKGASGAAIQNMNIMLGTDETCGLVVKNEH